MEKSIEIIIDEKIRILLDSIPKEVAQEIRDDFEHSNPVYHKHRSMGFWTKEEKVIKTWEHKKDKKGIWFLCLPRGGMSKVSSTLDKSNIEWDAIDERSEGKYLGTYNGDWVSGDIFPEHNLVLWDHQVRIVDAIEKYENCIVRSSTGCVTGDAMIGIHRAGRGKQLRLDHLVYKHNGGVTKNQIWVKSIQTKIRARMDDGTVRLINLVDAWESGERLVWEVELSCGYRITTTMNHKYLTPSGWKRLEELRSGDKVYIESSRRPKKKSKKSKQWYNLKVVKLHPFSARQGIKKGGRDTVPYHRLVMEARINKIDIEEYIERCNNDNDLRGLKFLDPDIWVVHHIDRNPRNNSLDNLQLLSHSEHKQLHADLARENIAIHTSISTIKYITPKGMQKTYDLELESPHNFIANGIVVHNSGKSSAVIAAIARLQLPSLVIVRSIALLNQWIDRISKEFGIAKKDIGVIQGKRYNLKPVTLAMQQTLNNYTPKRWKDIRNTFGFVACDEVQLVAAPTFIKSVDKFNSRYRVGVSADERRKDRKEFLIYDMFGRIAEDIPKKELVDKKLIHDVEAYIVPTEFRADWYRDSMINEKKTPDHKKLMDEMTTDTSRNELLRKTISNIAKKKYRMLVFSQRVEHCKRLDTLMTASGYKSGLLIGGNDYKDIFEATAQGLIDGSRQVGIGTLGGGSSVGLDLPEVSHGVLATPIHNNKQFLNQVTGRLCRIADNKNNAKIYILWDRYVFGKLPLLNFRRWYSKVKILDGRKWKDVNAFLKGYIDYEEKKKYEKEFGSNSPFISAQSTRKKGNQ